MTRVTPEQTVAILALLAEGKDRFEIAEELGVQPGQVIAVKAVASRIRDRPDIEEDGTIADAFETTFTLERDLQQALRKKYRSA